MAATCGKSKSRDSFIGFPPSKLSKTANSRDLSWINLASLNKYFARWVPDNFDHTFKPLLADSTAESISDLFPNATDESTSSVEGEIVLRYFFDFGD